MEKQIEELSLPIRLLIQGRNFEISTEGKASDIYKELELLAQFTNMVSQKLETVGITETELAITPTERVQVMGGIPAITASRSTIKNLRLVFDTNWGRSPRTLAEVIKALEINGVPDQASSVSRDLRRLVQRGFLRRIEKEGKYSYYRLPATE